MPFISDFILKSVMVWEYSERMYALFAYSVQNIPSNTADALDSIQLYCET